MRLVTSYKTYDNVEVHYNKYLNDNLAVSVVSAEDGEPLATLTVNLDVLMPGYAFVDTNNCPWAEDFIRENKLGEPTGTTRKSGYCTYPLYEFYNSVFEEEEKN